MIAPAGFRRYFEAGRGKALSKAMFSSSTLTLGSPRNPSCRPSMCCSTSLPTAAALALRSRATRLTCSWALAGEMDPPTLN